MVEVVVAIFKRKDSSFGTLETSPAPALEKIHLVYRACMDRKRGPFELFGGLRAPLTLKDFRVSGVPIALHPLRLAQLRRFNLGSHEPVTSVVVMKVLRESPELEELERTSFDGGNDPAPDEGHIQLPFLHRIYMFAVPRPLTQHIFLFPVPTASSELRCRGESKYGIL